MKFKFFINSLKSC